MLWDNIWRVGRAQGPAIRSEGPDGKRLVLGSSNRESGERHSAGKGGRKKGRKTRGHRRRGAAGEGSARGPGTRGARGKGRGGQRWDLAKVGDPKHPGARPDARPRREESEEKIRVTCNVFCPTILGKQNWGHHVLGRQTNLSSAFCVLTDGLERRDAEEKRLITVHDETG